MPVFLPDTSCLVAAVCGWHADHARASREVKQRLESAESLVLAAPSLVESYAVLSRLPPPRRLSPGEGWELLRVSFVERAAAVVALDSVAYRRLLEDAASRGVSGGGIYDAIIIGCAVAAKADAILTFNERQFRMLTPADVQVIVPA